MERIRGILLPAGGILVIIGLITRTFGWIVSPYLFCAGTILVAAVQITDRYTGDSPVIKRLRGQIIIASVLLVASGIIMLYGDKWHESMLFNQNMNQTLRSCILSLTQRNSWIALVSIATLFEVYGVFRMDSELKKEEDDEEQ